MRPVDSDLVSCPYDYYVPPPKTGESASVSGRVPKSLKAQIQRIVQSNVLPYSSEAELVYAAVAWFILEQLTPRMGGKFQDDMRLMAHHIAASKELLRVNAMSRFVKDTREIMQALAKEGAADQAVVVWRQALATAERMGEPARTNARDKLLCDREIAAVLVVAKNQGVWEESSDED